MGLLGLPLQVLPRFCPRLHPQVRVRGDREGPGLLCSVRGWTCFASDSQVQRLPRLSPGRRGHPLLVQCVRGGCVPSFLRDLGPHALDEAASQVSPGPSAGPVSQWASDALLQVCRRGRGIAREYRLAGSAPFTGRAGGRFGVRQLLPFQSGWPPFSGE